MIVWSLTKVLGLVPSDSPVCSAFVHKMQTDTKQVRCWHLFFFGNNHFIVDTAGLSFFVRRHSWSAKKILLCSIHMRREWVALNRNVHITCRGRVLNCLPEEFKDEGTYQRWVGANDFRKTHKGQPFHPRGLKMAHCSPQLRYKEATQTNHCFVIYCPDKNTSLNISGNNSRSLSVKFSLTQVKEWIVLGN